MTATLAASQAILKYRYPEGRLPKLVYEQGKFKYTSTVSKREDFSGELRVIAMQNENPQGSSADFQTALGSLAQGSYKRFLVTRVEHFGVARIKGQALKAAEGNEGALVDLWKNETDGISMTEMQNLEVYSFGNGSGVLGRVSSGQTTTTITLTVPTDAAKFALNMRVRFVSTNTLSPTVRSAGATGTITAIDRVTGTITAASAWNVLVPAVAANDYIVRAGDEASAGTGAVITGKQAWIPGGTAPGSLFQLDRNSDPVRFAGQAYNASGVPMEEAIIEASALVNQQGAPQPTRLWCNPRDLATFKKALGTKVTYEMADVKGTVAGVSFKGIVVEGDEERITLMTSPFVDRYAFHLDYPESWKLDTLGPAPQMLDFDGPNFLRVSSDDAYEVRFGMYGQHECSMPWANVTGSNWGA